MAVRKTIVECDAETGVVVKLLLSEIDVVIYGAFHQREHVANPRYVLNTSRGRFKTLNDEAFENRHTVECFCPLNDEGEPLWGNSTIGPEVILTLDENDKVIGIRPVAG